MLQLFVFPLLIAQPIPAADGAVPVESAFATLARNGEDTDGWTGSVNLGAAVIGGNTDRTTASVRANAERKDGDNRYALRTWWAYAEEDGGLTDRNAGLEADYNRFFSENTYGLVTTGIRTDTLALLDSRFFVGLGAGRQLIDKEKTKFAGDLALTYVRENFRRSVPATSDEEEFWALRASYGLSHQLSDATSFEQTLQHFQSVEDSDDYNFTLDSVVRFVLTDSWSAFFQWILDYDNTPATGADRTDRRLELGLTWNF